MGTIRLDQSDYNYFCAITYHSKAVYDFLDGVGKPDWAAHKDDTEQGHSKALYSHIEIGALLGKLDGEAKTVTITTLEYESLLQDSAFLGALDAAGVDGWDGYDFAQEILEGEIHNDTE